MAGPNAPSLSAMNGFLGIEETVPARADEFLAAPPRLLFAWWRTHAVAGPPHWGSLDTALLEAIEPHTTLVAVAPDGTFEVRLLGEAQAALLEPDRAGSRITPADPIENRRRLFDHYGWIVRHRRPLRCVGPLTFVGRSDLNFEALDVPLADEHGEVRRVIGVLVALP